MCLWYALVIKGRQAHVRERKNVKEKVVPVRDFETGLLTRSSGLMGSQTFRCPNRLTKM